MKQPITSVYEATNLIRKLTLYLNDIESFNFSKKQSKLTIKRKGKNAVSFMDVFEFEDYMEEVKIAQIKGKQ